MEINIIPGIKQSSSTVGPFVLKTQVNGQLIQSAEIDLGYCHRGIEQCFEKVPYMVGLVYSDKVDYLSAPACNLAFALAVEKLGGIRVPLKADFIRVILLELSRIVSHLNYISQVSLCVGSKNIHHFSLREREKYLDIFEMYCGSRIPFGSICIGGVRNNMSEGLLHRIEKTLCDTESFLLELDNILVKNPIFYERLTGLAILSPEKVKEHGITGANARCSGGELDIRKAKTYAAYSDLFVPIHWTKKQDGDCFDRFLYRFREIQQSIAIIRQGASRIPPGNFFVSIGMDFCPPRGGAYAEVESARGALGVFVSSDGSSKPARVKFSTPSFFMLKFLPQVLLKEALEDAPLIIHNFDISMSEVER